jgi:hypothetical protein
MLPSATRLRWQPRAAIGRSCCGSNNLDRDLPVLHAIVELCGEGAWHVEPDETAEHVGLHVDIGGALFALAAEHQRFQLFRHDHVWQPGTSAASPHRRDTRTARSAPDRAWRMPSHDHRAIGQGLRSASSGGARRQSQEAAQGWPVSGIFINYRGEDSKTAAALIDTQLTAQFGSDQVFLDSRSIPAGSDFAEELLAQLRACSVLLVVIGSRWLTLTDAAGQRRIDDPQDWIRLEILEAFSHGLRVIPVLTDDVQLPAAADLPDDIAGLSRRQYVPLRQRYTDVDLAFLTKRIKGIINFWTGGQLVSAGDVG